MKYAAMTNRLRDALIVGWERTPLPEDGPRWLLRWVLICLVAGLTLFLFCGYHGGFNRFNDAASGLPSWLWQWLTVLGDERVAFALTLFFSLRYPRVFWALILAAVIAALYTHSFKAIFGALRPPGVLDPDSFNLIGPGHRKSSFPSGHSATAGVFFAVLMCYVRTVPLRVLFILFALLAGLSRVAVGVHWPVDVAAGLMGGALSAYAGVRLAERTAATGRKPAVHLVLVIVAAAMAVSLIYSDGGYDDAGLMLQVLGISALVVAATSYLPRPKVLRR